MKMETSADASASAPPADAPGASAALDATTLAASENASHYLLMTDPDFVSQELTAFLGE